MDPNLLTFRSHENSVSRASDACQFSCKRTFICLCKITRTSVDQTASVIQLMWKYVERQLTTHFSKVRYSYIRGCTFLVSYKQRSCPIIEKLCIFICSGLAFRAVFSRGQQHCKCAGTKESFYETKRFNSLRTGLDTNIYSRSRFCLGQRRQRRLRKRH